MKAQLATPATGSPARSLSPVQRRASAGRAPASPGGLAARAGRSEYAMIHAAAARGIATSWPAPPQAGAIPRSFGRHDGSSVQAHARDAAATTAPAPSPSVQHPARGDANAPVQAAPADVARQEVAPEGDASSAPGVPAFAFGDPGAFAGIPGMLPPTPGLASRAIAQPKLSIGGLPGAAAAPAIAPTGGGSPLPDPTRARMERLFGSHLDGVRLVESGQPEQLGARAFAIGDEIHAARGEDLTASRSAELLGHELAHVVQQRQGRARPGAAQHPGSALVVDAALEAEADAVGARIGRGEPAGIGGATAACPAPVVQGYRIDLEDEAEQFDDVGQLIEAFKRDGLVSDIDWSAVPRALLFQWMRENRTFASRAALIDELANTPAPRQAAAPTTVNQLRERYAGVFAICTSADQVGIFVGSRRAITQVPQERGDMYDVASALALDRGLCVVVFPENGVADCDKILEFYRDVDIAERVCLVADNRVHRRQLLDNQQFLKVSGSTQTMQEHRNDQGFRARLVKATAGPINAEDNAAFDEELTRRGFRRGTRYALVMYRDSGHRPGEGRAPSHPELDTGIQGFNDLGGLIHRAGLTPVPMGTQVPPNFDIGTQPNLINYWAWDCFRAYPDGTNRRQKENALLRYLHDKYKVVAIGMRSGGMDALAYVGIPIISIDAAVEFMEEQGGISENSAKSWRRAAKKEDMLAGTYHNVYLEKLRPDDPSSAVGFTGAFGLNDKQQLSQAVARYFDPAYRPAPGNRDLGPTSPLRSRNIGLLIKYGMLERKEDSNFFNNYAEDPELLKPLKDPALRDALRNNPRLRDDPTRLVRLLGNLSTAWQTNRQRLKELLADQRLLENPAQLEAQVEELLSDARRNPRRGSTTPSARGQRRLAR